MGQVKQIEYEVQTISMGPGAKAKRDMRVADRLAELVGREVVVEATFPTPVQTPQGPALAWGPIKGKLVAVYADGFEVLSKGDAEAQVFWVTNVRSVQPFSELAVPTGAGRLQ